MGYETNRDRSNAMKKTMHPSWEYRGRFWIPLNKPVLADGFGLIPSGDYPGFSSEHSL